MNWKNIFFGILIFLIGIGIGAYGFYYFSPTIFGFPKETNTKKTSTEQGWMRVDEDILPFSFEYPPDWHVSIDTMRSENRETQVWLSKKPVIFIASEQPPGNLVITDYHYVNSEAEDFPYKNFKGALDHYRKNLTDLKESTIIVDGVKVYKIEGELTITDSQGGGKADQVVYLFEFRSQEGEPTVDHIVEAGFGGRGVDSTLLNTLEKIVKSIKFDTIVR